jgi:ankyrin repeat protein
MHTLPIALAAAVTFSSLACAQGAAPPTVARCPPPVSMAPPAHAAKTHTADELFSALDAGDITRLDVLLDDDPTLAGARSPKGLSAILVAAFTQNPDHETFVKPSYNALLRALIARRPPLDVFDAAVAGDTARLEALLSGDASAANAVHPRLGLSPLHLAAFADRTDAIALLLAKGAVLDAVARNRFHNTPLVVAMLGDAVNAAALLLSKGANVEAPEEGGARALHLAAESGDERLVTVLLDHRAQIDARSDDGTTPLGVAMKKGREAIAKLLRSRGAS